MHIAVLELKYKEVAVINNDLPKSRADIISCYFTEVDRAFLKQTEELEQSDLFVEFPRQTSLLQAARLWLLQLISQRRREEPLDRDV